MILSLIQVPEWPPFWEGLLIQLTICSLCYVYLVVLGQKFGSDSASFWPLLSFTFLEVHATV